MIESTIPHQSDDIWGEFVAKDGRFYYYNRLKKFSIWARPSGLVLPLPHQSHHELAINWRNLERIARVNDLKKQAKADMPLKMCVVQGTDWKLTSTWDCPDELASSFEQQLLDAKQQVFSQSENVSTFVEGTEMGADDIGWMLEQIQDQDAESDESLDNDPEPVDEQSPVPSPIPILETKDSETLESKTLKFKEMLLEGNIDPFGSWEKEALVFVGDPRFDGTFNIPSPLPSIPNYISLDSQDRKTVFDSVCKQILADRKAPKKEYSSVFETFVAENCGSPPMDWKRFSQKFKKDSRFLTVKSLPKREKLYLQFVSRLHSQIPSSSTTKDLVREYTLLVKDFFSRILSSSTTTTYVASATFSDFSAGIKTDSRFAPLSDGEKKIIFFKFREKYSKKSRPDSVPIDDAGDSGIGNNPFPEQKFDLVEHSASAPIHEGSFLNRGFSTGSPNTCSQKEFSSLGREDQEIRDDSEHAVRRSGASPATGDRARNGHVEYLVRNLVYNKNKLKSADKESSGFSNEKDDDEPINDIDELEKKVVSSTLAVLQVKTSLASKYLMIHPHPPSF
ncbi:Transcription elongation regulator 1 [Smittium mucronatum]|uniref:Transcription elongation regulator 1 n=1 Tax=Smittium mucronatum TaxID=133383 RepID=A0A1R0GMH5_9FUNG|nr:Transcription elongation regulator 1 [Smittium mucronatum]